MKLVLANLASPANPGDQAILRGSLKLLNRYYSFPRITLATRAFSERSAYEALGCRVVPSYPDVNRLDQDSILRRMCHVPRTLASPSPLREAIRESDAVFLAGGAYFYSYRFFVPGLTFFAHLSPVYWARKFRKPVVILPQSYGPFRSRMALLLMDAAVRSSRLLYYREGISGDWLKGRYFAETEKFFFLPDLALYLEKSDLLKTPCPEVSGPKILGVTVRPWRADAADEGYYLTVLAKALAQFHQAHRVKIRIIVQVQADKSSEGDGGVSKSLLQTLQRKIGRDAVELCAAKPYFNLPELCRLYRECDLLVAMRLHSSLLSFLVERPAFVIGYQHKTRGVLDSLGLKDFYGGYYDAVRLQDMLNGLNKLWRDREDGRRKVREALAATRAGIESNFAKSMKEFGL